MLDTDQMPASFWITNPDNTYIGNHAAGSDHCNFWYKLDDHPSGPSATTSICPKGAKLGLFTDNVAHSGTRYGLRIFDEYVPREFPCLPIKKKCESDFYAHNPPIEAVFQNFLTYKNEFNGVITEKSGMITLKNITTLENELVEIEISTSDLSPDQTARVF
jgi:hypothetical protein